MKPMARIQEISRGAIFDAPLSNGDGLPWRDTRTQFATVSANVDKGVTRFSQRRKVNDTWAGNGLNMFRRHYRLAVCTECGTESVQRRRVPRHELHLALTVLTLGVWGVCWIITIIAARWEPWRCRECRLPQAEEAMRPEPAPVGAIMSPAFGLVHEQVD